jgi:outer membrane immunogenic protein
MPVKAPYLKAPAPAYSWTGCYLGGGGGYGLWGQDFHLETSPAHLQITSTETSGGRGWFGTVTGGCDYQLNSVFVVGAFADGDWGSLSGNYSTSGGFAPATIAAGAGIVGGGSIGALSLQGTETERSAWAVGGRLGWLVAPTVPAFWDGGYTQAYFSQINLSSTGVPSVTLGLDIPAQTYNGWFLGGGFDYALPFFSGLSWQTEYRHASYRAVDTSTISSTTGTPSVLAVSSQPYVQTVRSELIYRFNWAGH